MRCPRSDRAGVVQALPGRPGGHRNRGCVDVVECIGRARQVGFLHGHEVGVGAGSTQRAHDALACLEARHAGAYGLHLARQFDAQHGRQLQREGVANVALADFPVDAVHAGGANADEHLPWPGFGCGDLAHFDGVGATIGPDQYSALSRVHFRFLNQVAVRTK